MGTTSYTVAGSYTWTCPTGVTTVTVEAWGGGGSGASSGLSHGGGSGGDYAKLNSFTTVPTTGYTVVVGGANADSYFDTGSLINAMGGQTPALIGLNNPSVGDVIYTGGLSGASAGKGSVGGGGGGSGAGTASNGNNGSPNSGSAGGAGGTAVTGGGAGGAGGTVTTSPNGVAGSAPAGAGGGGASGGAGGTGASGQVIITWGSSNAFTHDPVGSLTARGVQVNRTTGIITTNTGKLSANGLGNGTQVGSFTYSPSGGVGQVTAPHGGSPRVGGTFNVGGAKRSTSPTNSDHVRVGGAFSSVGGGVGSVASPANSNNVQVGVAFNSGGGRLGHTLTNGFGGDSGSDAFQGEGEGSGGSSGGGNTDTGFPTTSSTWTPCCLLPDKESALCCNCTSFTWQWWEITEIDQFTDAFCSVEFPSPYVLTLTNGCGLNNSSALRYLGPSPAIGAYNPRQGHCNWMSWPYVWEQYGGGGDPYYFGHGNPPTSDFYGCCYLLPNIPPTDCEKRMGWQMGCQPATSSVYIPPQYAWVSPDCVECDSGLFLGPDNAIEMSLEDCEAFYGVGNCHCSGEEVIQQFATEELCQSYGCTSCTQIITVEHQYTPPFPALWFLAWFGPCGCGGPVYISTTSDHPLYGFYQPTSGLDNQDQCGNYYYQHWGALDATGPFDCTSGGRFTLLNFVQTNIALEGAPCSENPCNIGTNVMMGHDPVCAAACNGYNFADCHAGCTTHGIYATVAPMESMKELPYTQWIVNDTNGNLLCCPSSDTSASLPPDAGDTTSVFSMTDFSPPKMRFKYAQFGGDFEQVDEGVWLMNYPPLQFEMVKRGSDYFVNDVKLEVICDDPLIGECVINKKLLEVTFV